MYIHSRLRILYIDGGLQVLSRFEHFSEHLDNERDELAIGDLLVLVLVNFLE